MALFLGGGSPAPEEIASDRGLTPGTILNHLTHGVKIGKIQVEALVPQEAIWEIQGVTEQDFAQPRENEPRVSRLGE